jgi:acetoin utilization protein AcuC
MGLGTPECPVFKGMVDYAMLACGATLTGMRLLLDGEADRAFNPSGGYHHAGPARASGFCYINDVALACQAFADAGKRVAYVDVDVHHGDGVQAFFYDRSDVLTLSIHETGETLFPGTGRTSEIGEGEGRGYSVNVPVPPDTYDEAYVRVFLEVALPILRAYDPDVVVYEVGMDCLSGDPLAHLNLTNNAYADVTELVLGMGKPMLAAGGGGYHPENTARGWALVWSVLCGEDHHEPGLGMGGVMLESSDWLGGLRDRVLVPEPHHRETVEPAVDAVIQELRSTVFPIHGLSEGGTRAR